MVPLLVLLALSPQQSVPGAALADPASLGPRGRSESPLVLVAAGVRDEATGGVLGASSVPALGSLYPLSSELFVDATSGWVGVGTLVPASALDVSGLVSASDGLRVGLNQEVFGARSSILAGSQNLVVGDEAVVCGGLANQVLGAFTQQVFLGAGASNEITGFPGTFATASAIVAGSGNRIDASVDAFVGGGTSNEVRSADGGVVGGGQGNSVRAPFATVPGGRLNQAWGIGSLAAGNRSQALHDGAFVWADGQASTFASSAPDQFLVRAAGGVGINESAPTTLLHVQGQDLGFVQNFSGNVDGIAVEAQDAALTLASAGSGTAGSALSLQEWASGSLIDNWSLYRRTAASGDPSLRLTYGPGSNWANNPVVATFTPFGFVGIGTTTPSAPLEVAGTVAAAAFVQTSDARLKTDVRPLEGALETVRALRGVRYAWDREHGERLASAEPGEHLGLLAQEVRAVLPEVVREASDGTLGVSYVELVPVLIEALHELEAEVAALRAELARGAAADPRGLAATR